MKVFITTCRMVITISKKVSHLDPELCREEMRLILEATIKQLKEMLYFVEASEFENVFAPESNR